MSSSWLRRRFDAGEISTALGRALVEERYLALRRQVPAIYLLAVVNLFALQITTTGWLTFGANLPSLLILCAIVRATQWMRAAGNPPHWVMLRRMRQTCWLAAILCFTVCIWCLQLLDTAPSGTHIAIVLFGGITAMGVAFGLSALPLASCIPLLVLGLPLAGTAIVSPNPKFVGAAISLLVVALLILQLVARQSAQFTAVVKSRWMISREQDMTERARQEAIVAATTDFLTGLPNRRAFVAALDARDMTERGDVAVAVIDVDRFKVINDTYGHAYGDVLLKAVGRRLQRSVNDRGLVARLGGDEFGLLLTGVRTSAEAREFASQLLATANRPMRINGRQFAVSSSCGIALPRPGAASSSLRVLSDADIALYEAKCRSGGKIAVFEAQMEAPRLRRAEIEQALRVPDVHEDIDLVFQPIVNLLSGKIVANEALARWHNPKLGDISPSEFIPIAEQLEVIGNISDRLLERALTEATAWPRQVRLSFNLSAVQLGSVDLAEKVLAALRTHGFEPQRLQVEVTETALFADFERARLNLATLRTAGVMVALDDFGAGYASIGYLREFQFDQIKLDGALVTAGVGSADGERLLGAVIGLCRGIEVPTVAEHVESEQHLLMLKNLGCTLGQGFWLQPPQPAEDVHDVTIAASHRGKPLGSMRRSAA